MAAQMCLTLYVNDLVDAKKQITIAKVKDKLDHYKWGEHYRKYRTKVDTTPLAEILDDLGFSYIGAGVSREVYGCGDLVIKIEVHGQTWAGKWLEQNKEELENYKNIPEDCRQYFPTIFDYDSSLHPHWLIVERAQVKACPNENGDEEEEDEEGIDWYALSDKLEDILREKHHIPINDVLPNNVGIIGTRTVVIDFGFEKYFEKRRK